MAERVDEREERNRGEFSGAASRETKSNTTDERDQNNGSRDVEAHIGKASE